MISHLFSDGSTFIFGRIVMFSEAFILGQRECSNSSTLNDLVKYICYAAIIIRIVFS